MTPKFKAITTDGKWVKGSLAYMFEDQKSPCIMPKCYSLSRFSEDVNGKVIRMDDLMLGGFIEVIPETVCVEVKCGNETYFVGDTYKLWCDSHGKLGHAKKDFNVVVIYDEQDAQFKFQDIEKKHWKWTINDTDFNGVRFQRELTGNIHDHLVKPYLLKKVSNDQ